MEILEILASVPDVIWSGLIASVVTLSGVMLSNRSNTKRLLHQLAHDSQEKHKERFASMRREVYLKAAEEMAKVSSFFGRLPQIDPTEGNLGEGLSDFLGASAKAQLVCDAQTATLLGELTARFGEIYMDLLMKVQPVHDLKLQIDLVADFLDRSQAEASRSLSEMRQLNESGRPDPARYAALTATFDSSQKLADDYAKEREGLYADHEAALKGFNVLLMQEMRSIGELQVHVTAAVRRELSLETDVGDYEARLQENWKRLDAKMSQVLAHIEKG